MKENTMINRRSAIATLGLGGAASGASVIEALGAASAVHPSHGVVFNVPHKDTMVKALRALADEIEGDRAYAMESSLLTELKPDEFVIHKLSINFYLKPDTA